MHSLAPWVGGRGGGGGGEGARAWRSSRGTGGCSVLPLATVTCTPPTFLYGNPAVAHVCRVHGFHRQHGSRRADGRGCVHPPAAVAVPPRAARVRGWPATPPSLPRGRDAAPCAAKAPPWLLRHRPLLLAPRFPHVACRAIGSYAEIVEEMNAFRITDWPLFAKCGELIADWGADWGCARLCLQHSKNP